MLSIFCMQVNNRAGLLFISVVMLFFGLYSVINPKAVSKENSVSIKVVSPVSVDFGPISGARA